MGLPAFVPAAFTAALLWACTALPVPQPKAAEPVGGQFPVRLDYGTSCGIAGLRESTLRRVNAARAAARSCGRRQMQPAPPLEWDDALFSAAARHSQDMARRDYFNHASPDGKRVGARLLAEGYRWRSVGENIAGGDRSVETVVRGWMDSAGHCANIMNAEFTEIGLACVERKGSTWGTYWTMVLGRPR
ncbi:MAG: CAP domain-containing protein [Ramlibacter sp.]|nr:CAP domain-containing protein [Ramlibacter sp.]